MTDEPMTREHSHGCSCPYSCDGKCPLNFGGPCPMAVEIQTWERSPGRWITIDRQPEGDALAVAQRLAAIEPDVRVARHGESIARWLFGQRTIR